MIVQTLNNKGNLSLWGKQCRRLNKPELRNECFHRRAGCSVPTCDCCLNASSTCLSLGPFLIAPVVFHITPALNMKFQLPGSSLPAPDKIANSLVATIRININSLPKWVSEFERTGQTPLKIWRPLKEAKSVSDVKRNAREVSGSPRGREMPIGHWRRRGAGPHRPLGGYDGRMPREGEWE